MAFFLFLEIPGLAYLPLISKLLFALSGSWSEIRVLKQRLSLFPTPTCSFLCNSPGTKLLYLSSGDPQFLILQMFQMSKKSKLSSATSAGYTLYKLLLKSKLAKRKLWKELPLLDILCPFSDDAVGRKFQKTGVTQQLKILGLFLQHFLRQNFPITFPSPPLLPAELKSIILVLPWARVRYLCGMVGKRKRGD